MRGWVRVTAAATLALSVLHPPAVAAETTVNGDGDRTRPVLVLESPTLAWTLDPTVSVSWVARDLGSGIARQELWQQTVGPDGRLGSGFVRPLHPAASATTIAARPGWTYCFRARAIDAAGNVGTYSIRRCTAVPLEPDALDYGPGWDRAEVAGGYAGYDHRSTTAGAEATLPDVVARRVALVATTCSSCGRLNVYWNGRYQGMVNLESDTTQRSRIVPLFTLPAPEAGTLTLRVVGPDRTVAIEGLGISKR